MITRSDIDHFQPGLFACLDRFHQNNSLINVLFILIQIPHRYRYIDGCCLQHIARRSPFTVAAKSLANDGRPSDAVKNTILLILFTAFEDQGRYQDQDEILKKGRGVRMYLKLYFRGLEHIAVMNYLFMSMAQNIQCKMSLFSQERCNNSGHQVSFST